MTTTTKKITLTNSLLAALRQRYEQERDSRLPLNEHRWFSPFAAEILRKYAWGELVEKEKES